MHQLPPEETGGFGAVGVAVLVTGIVEAGETVSGLELGLKIGDVEMMGVVGTMFGTVVMGVVMSFLVVDIGDVNSSGFSLCDSTFTCPIAFLSVLEPAFDMMIKVRNILEKLI